MSGAPEAAKKGLHLGLAAITHVGWWLQWQADGHASREVTELGQLPPRTVQAERPAA
ncbi:MAG TPA: hypothetical protein VF056_09760 [Thermoleophilaceae bacterium]